MERAKTGLELLVDIVCDEVGVELSGNSFFKDFGNKGKIGDGAEVIEVVWIQAGFFQNWSDRGSFE